MTPRRNQRGPSTPTKRTSWAPPCRPGAGTGTWARSSQPSGPSTSSMMPPCWVMPEAISSRTSPQMPSFLGAAKACSCTALSPQHHGRGDDRVTGDLDAQLHALDTGHEEAAQVDPAVGRVFEHLGDVPRAVGPRGRRQVHPARRDGVVLLARHRPCSSRADAVHDLLGRAAVLGGIVLLATSEHVTVLPGRIRPKRIDSHPLTSPGSGHGRMTAGGPETPLGPGRAGKFRHLVEAHLLDLLDNQLGNAVETLEPHALARVEIDHDHLDLPTVPGIHRPRGIHEGDPAAGGQAGSRVHEGRVPVGQGDGHPGGQHGALAGGQLGGLGGHQIAAGVAGVPVRRERDLRVDAADQHVDVMAGRGRSGTSGVHLEGACAPDLVGVGHGRPDLLGPAVVDEVVDLDLDEEGVGADGDRALRAADPADGGAVDLAAGDGGDLGLQMTARCPRARAARSRSPAGRSPR